MKLLNDFDSARFEYHLNENVERTLQKVLEKFGWENELSQTVDKQL